jgi:hypothetical protein
VVTRDYFAQVWWNTTLQRHPELISDPNAQAQMRSAHEAAVSEGLAPGNPDYQQYVEEQMGWQGSRSSQRSIPQALGSQQGRPVERHGYSGAEMTPVDNLTEAEAAKISGVDLDGIGRVGQLASAGRLTV